MNIHIDQYAGFCPGVRKAIRIAEEKVRKGESVTTLGGLIHNKREIERLKKLGLQEINQDQFEKGDIAKDLLKNQTLLIRAHGISPELFNKVKSQSFSYINATCHLVERSQKIVQQYCNDGYHVVIVGKAHHPEVKGLLGFCKNQGVVIYHKGDEDKVLYKNKVLLIAQTTIDTERFDYFRKKLEKGVDELVVKNTICPIVTNRQQQIIKFARENDLIIFIADATSSNSKVLFELSKRHNSQTFFITSTDELKPEWFTNVENVGLTGGASTPDWQLEEVKQIIEQKFINLK